MSIKIENIYPHTVSDERSRRNPKDKIDDLVPTETPEAEFSQNVEATVRSVEKLIGDQYSITKQTHVVEGRRLGKLNDRLVWFTERDRVYVDHDFLLRGLIATRWGKDPDHISNSDSLNTPELDVFEATRQRANRLGIDLAKADKGHTIDLSQFSDTERANLESVIDVNLSSAKTQDIRWPTHKGLTQAGLRQIHAVKMKIEKSDETGLQVELTPEKRYSIAPVESAYIIEPKTGTEHRTLLDKEASSKLAHQPLSQVDQHALKHFKTLHAGMRVILKEALHRVAGNGRVFTDPDGQEISRSWSTLTSTSIHTFEDPVETLQADHLIETMHHGLLKSGAHIFFKNILGGTPDETKQRLSLLDPTQARATVREAFRLIDYYENVRLPELPQAEDNKPPVKQVFKKDRQDLVGDPKEKTSRKIGIPENILPSCVTGVAHLLNLMGTKVYDANEKDKLPKGAIYWYGTTNKGNAVEAIMAAHAAKMADGSTGSCIYITDAHSHTVGSYLGKMLHTLTSIYHLPDTERDDIQRKLDVFGNLTDTSISKIISTAGSETLEQYLTSLAATAKLPVKETTLNSLYHELNTALCHRLGIKHISADSYLRETKLTVGDIVERAETISKSAGTALEQLQKTLRERELSEKSIQDLLQDAFGENPDWEIKSRKFIRKNHGDEESVDITTLDPSTLLADLPNQGLTMGGNGWVIAVQLAAEKQRQDIVMAHTNTIQGSNYVLPTIDSPNTYILVSPLVRVVTDPNDSSKGHKVDLGYFLLNPELTDAVIDAYKIDHPKVIGGKEKVVVDIENKSVWIGGVKRAVIKITTSTEPWNGGRKKEVATKYLNIDNGHDSDDKPPASPPPSDGGPSPRLPAIPPTREAPSAPPAVDTQAPPTNWVVGPEPPKSWYDLTALPVKETPPLTPLGLRQITPPPPPPEPEIDLTDTLRSAVKTAGWAAGLLGQSLARAGLNLVRAEIDRLPDQLDALKTSLDISAAFLADHPELKPYVAEAIIGLSASLTPAGPIVLGTIGAAEAIRAATTVRRKMNERTQAPNPDVEYAQWEQEQRYAQQKARLEEGRRQADKRQAQREARYAEKEARRQAKITHPTSADPELPPSPAYPQEYPETPDRQSEPPQSYPYIPELDDPAPVPKTHRKSRPDPAPKSKQYYPEDDTDSSPTWLEKLSEKLDRSKASRPQASPPANLDPDRSVTDPPPPPNRKLAPQPTPPPADPTRDQLLSARQILYETGEGLSDTDPSHPQLETVKNGLEAVERVLTDRAGRAHRAAARYIVNSNPPMLK